MRGEQLDNRRLNHRHERHVTIRGDGHCAEQVRCEFGSEVNGGRAVRAADDADGGRLIQLEIKNVIGAQRGEENADLSGCPKQESDRAAEQRAKVGQGSNAHENNRRE